MRKLLNVVVSICLALFVIGSSVIITMNIKRLGGNPIITACVGNDGLGKFLINHLKIYTRNYKKIKER